MATNENISLPEWLEQAPPEAKLGAGFILVFVIVLLILQARMSHFNGVVDGVDQERQRTGRWN